MPYPSRTTTNAPETPVVVFDGDCGFCKFWVERCKAVTKERFRYEPSQTEAAKFPDIPEEAFQEAVQLIERDGAVYSGADAAFKMFEGVPWWGQIAHLFETIPGGLPFSRWFYGIVARHRMFFSFLTKLVWGLDPRPSTYVTSRRLFALGLGLVFFCAFASLGVQERGLFGSHGISPSADFLRQVHEYFVQEHRGAECYWKVPSVFWINSSDGVLVGGCIVGSLLSLALAAGVCPGLLTLLCWGLYLSYCSSGSPFLNFQWDALLLETALVAAVYLPWRFRPRWNEVAPASTLGRWLVWWLVFRQMFESGIVKLSYDDPTWWNLTATTYHYYTQPLPLWTAWYVNQAPLWYHKLEVWLVYIIEMGLPFLIVFPRRLRHTAAIGMIALQVFIMATGNYAFFNWLTIAICLPLFDDVFWANLRRRVTRKAAMPASPSPMPATGGQRFGHWIVAPFAAVAGIVTLGQLLNSFEPKWPLWGPLKWFAETSNLSGVREAIGPYSSFNSYGLFRVMTTTRPEIIVEGSNDGQTWLDYHFCWKPGDVRERPHLVAPHQPRLDWQMWFAALGSYRQNPWFIAFLDRLLDGSPDVLALLDGNPFPDKPPRYVRALLYEYKFTRFGDGSAWWQREFQGLYCPTLRKRTADDGEPGRAPEE